MSPWTVAHQAPLSTGILQARILEWVAISFYICIYNFPGSSAGRESICNARDPSLIPGLVRFPGEGIGYQFQYSWASLVAQLVKNLPAMQET